MSYIIFLAVKEGHQPPYRGPTRLLAAPRVGGVPHELVGPSGIVSHGFFFTYLPNIPKIFFVRFYPVWIPFNMGFLLNIKHATNRNWHWALDQYVSPKNSIKSCQKYIKVIEYWHGTIKNYRYDGDLSAPHRTRN